MNIFYLDEDPVLAARSHCDKHVVKMILESAQIACSVCDRYGVPATYRPTHRNHPCVLWAGDSRKNLNYLFALGLALGTEYTYRYGKTHKSVNVLFNAVHAAFSQLPHLPFTPPPQCMPDEYRTDDTVLAYRAYYRDAKSSILTYKRRPRPEWL